MKTLSLVCVSVAIAAFIISYFSVHSLVFENPFVDHCRVNELAKELFKPITYHDDEEECGENEVYHIANVTNHAFLGCKSGCYCKKGYMRKKYSEKCKPAEHYGKKCKKNEELRCGKSDCEPFCDIDQDQLCTLNRFDCSFKYNCYCKEGYIRIDHGSCIKISECPMKLYESPDYHEL